MMEELISKKKTAGRSEWSQRSAGGPCVENQPVVLMGLDLAKEPGNG